MKLLTKTSGKLMPLLLLLTAVSFFSVLWIHFMVKAPGVSNFRAYTQDRCIDLSWDSTGAGMNDVIELTIASEKEQRVLTLPPQATGYAFKDGGHGEQYTFSIALKAGQTLRGQEQTAMALFLDYSGLPQLPIFRIETVNGTELPYTVVSAPSGYWGISLADNDYVDARIVVSAQNSATKNLSGQIRIRGNTSALGEKKPYKLKLEQAADLLGLGNGCKDRDWTLLPFSYALKTISGLKVSQLCGMQWQPRSTPVNVMINGDWKGCYLLVESVKAGQHRVNIGTDGFLIENDAYWWKETGACFKTEHQRQELAYTFQHPDGQTVSDRAVAAVSDFMNAYERALLEGNGDYRDYIDLDSFAGWLLAHDILGTWDAGGANMFLYKYDMTPSSKLHMGPLWDFSSAFQQTDQWATIHNSASLHYDVLLQDPDFSEAYRKKWAALADVLSDEMCEYFKDYMDQYGAALTQSLELDLARYGTDDIVGVPLEQSVQLAQSWFESRVAWLNAAMAEI